MYHRARDVRITFKTAILAAAACLLAALPGRVAADFHAGQDAYEKGDFEAARREWMPLALAGDPETQYRIARMYAHGQLEQSDTEALRWYTMAAERGHAAAQNNLGLMYEQGRGAPADATAAVGWYERAADQGLAIAEANLARAYDRGIGVPEDPAKAARWYEKAASQKHAPSQFRLGEMYEQGRGVPRNPKQASKWYRRASRGGHAAAAAALGQVEYRRFAEEARSWGAAAEPEAAEPGPVEPTPVEPTAGPAPAAPAAAGSVAALRERAEQGDPEAQFELGRLHAAGSGVALNMETAASWYLAAARGGHAVAAYTVAFQYYRGRGVKQDLVEAYRWFDVAAERGVGDAAAWRDEVFSRMSKKDRKALEQTGARPQD